MAKTTKAELLRLALLYAIQDRDGYAEADPGEEGKRAAILAAEFRAYLMERFGQEPAGDVTDRLPSISIHDLPPSSKAKFG